LLQPLEATRPEPAYGAIAGHLAKRSARHRVTSGAREAVPCRRRGLGQRTVPGLIREGERERQEPAGDDVGGTVGADPWRHREVSQHGRRIGPVSERVE
jgi:hypothetical protein